MKQKHKLLPLIISIPIIIITLIVIYFEIQWFCIRFGWQIK